MSETSIPFLPYGRQHLDDDDVAAVVATLQSDWLTQGPAVEAFEATLAARLSVPHAVVCNSGSAALHLASIAAGLGPGKIAVVPSLTFVATANMARLTGAEVVFADVDPLSGLMRPDDLLDALARAGREWPDHEPACVLPVHLNGQCVELNAIGEIANNSNLRVVEDACHALGAEHRSASNATDGLDGWFPVGACRSSLAACFSFHPVKSIAAGEGGAVTLRDDEAAERVRTLRSHGLERVGGDAGVDRLPPGLGPNGDYPGAYGMYEMGFNYRLSDIHSALGASQLKKLDGFLAHRRALVARYDEALAQMSDLASPITRMEGSRSAHHLYPVLLGSRVYRPRGEIMRALRERNVGTQVHYIPVHRQPFYAGRYGVADLPGADAYFSRVLSLPLFVDMTAADVDRVVDVLGDVLSEDAS